MVAWPVSHKAVVWALSGSLETLAWPVSHEAVDWPVTTGLSQARYEAVAWPVSHEDSGLGLRGPKGPGLVLARGLGVWDESAIVMKQ